LALGNIDDNVWNIKKFTKVFQPALNVSIYFHQFVENFEQLLTYPGVSLELCFEALIKVPIHDNRENITHRVTGERLDSNNIEMT
jgi:hypothetical protein